MLLDYYIFFPLQFNFFPGVFCINQKYSLASHCDYLLGEQIGLHNDVHSGAWGMLEGVRWFPLKRKVQCILINYIFNHFELSLRFYIFSYSPARTLPVLQ